MTVFCEKKISCQKHRSTMAISYHVRSTSLPSRSHPTILRIEEELNKLKKWESSTTSTSSSMCSGLFILEDLYKCMDELLGMASTQEVLSCGGHEKYFEELLDGSVKLLDVCNISRDILLQFKEQAKSLQSALRRRKGDSSCKKEVANYISFTKKMRKDCKKLITALKQMDNKLEACPLVDPDHSLSAVIRVLGEVSGISSSVFKSLLLLLSATMSKSKGSKWSLVSKLMNKGQALETSIEDIENCLERVFSYHVRSTSLPSRSHPTILKIEEELNKLKKWESSTTSTSSSICSGLFILQDLYKCMDELLSMTSTQEVLSCGGHEKYFDELLDGSVKLLDVCNISSDILLQFKEQAKALQSAVRRRKGDSSCKKDVANYMSFTKKMKKDCKKLITALKQMDNKLEACPLVDPDHSLSAVIRVLREIQVRKCKLLFRDCRLWRLALKISRIVWSVCSVSMVAFSPKSHRSYNARSISFPARSHPSFGKLEEHLNKLTSCVEATPTFRADTLCTNLSSLAEVYRCMEGLLNLPLTQQALAQKKEEQWVNGMLDDLIRYLDVCGKARDGILLMKESVRELLSALRRSKAGGELSIESNVSDYISSRKQMKKEIAKSLALLKQMDNKNADVQSPLLEADHYLSALVRVLKEASLISVSILSSLLLFLSAPMLKPRTSRWSLVSKLVHKGVVACELGQQDSVNEFESVDIAVTNLVVHNSKDSLDPAEKVQSAQTRLEVVDTSIEELED
ncbi:hypothetical protein Tsubulata_015702, partial [Turnera subulata]